MNKRRWSLLVVIPGVLLTLTMVVEWPLRQIRTAQQQEVLFTSEDVPDNVVINEERNSLCMNLQIGDFMRSAELIGPDFKNMTADQIKQAFASQMNVWLLEYNTLIARGDFDSPRAVPTHWAEALAGSNRCRTFLGDCCCCYVNWPGKWSNQFAGLCDPCQHPYICNYTRVCRTPLSCLTDACFGSNFDCSNMGPCTQVPADTCP